MDKILSNKSKPPTKILILLCFNSPYYILVFFIIVRWGEWRLGPDGKLPARHTLVVLLTCLHRHVSSEKLTGHSSIIWMHTDAESGLPFKIVVVLMLGSNSHWGRPQRERAWRRMWEKPCDEKKEWRSSEFRSSHFSANSLWSQSISVFIIGA